MQKYRRHRADSKSPTDEAERLYRQRRREAIRRAENRIDRLFSRLWDLGRVYDGERVWQFYQEIRAEELAALAVRESRRAQKEAAR